MAFIRAKYINGEYYYYLVESRREGKVVYQDIVEYLGKRKEAEGYAEGKGLKMPKVKEPKREVEKELDKKISEKKKQLDLLRPFPKVLEQRLREDLIILWTYHSTVIEGSTLSLKETATLLEEGIVTGNKPLTDYMAAKGHRDAINLVFKWIAEKKKKLSKKDLLLLHKATMKNVIDAYLGIYRPVQVYLTGSSYTPPPPEQVPKLISEFLYKSNRNLKKYDPITLAALTHLDFESIHPFVDGNGRAGRLIANWLLMRDGYPPIVITKRERLRYFRLLEQAQTKYNVHKLVIFFKKKALEAFDFYLKRLKPYSVVPKRKKKK